MYYHFLTTGIDIPTGSNDHTFCNYLLVFPVGSSHILFQNETSRVSVSFLDNALAPCLNSFFDKIPYIDSLDKQSTFHKLSFQEYDILVLNEIYGFMDYLEGGSIVAKFFFSFSTKQISNQFK
jgi:hypothetical protein